MCSSPAVTRNTLRGSERLVSLSQVLRPLRSLPLNSRTTSLGLTAASWAISTPPASARKAQANASPIMPTSPLRNTPPPLPLRPRLGRCLRQEGEQPAAGGAVQRRPVLRHLERLDVAHPRAALWA